MKGSWEREKESQGDLWDAGIKKTREIEEPVGEGEIMTVPFIGNVSRPSP